VLFKTAAPAQIHRSPSTSDAFKTGVRAAGHEVHPLTLSGLSEEPGVDAIGLASHVDDVRSLLEAGNLRDVTLVGHSYSGIVAGQVADRMPDRVARTVYVEAFLPVDGESLLDTFPEPERAGEHRQIAEHGGRWPAPEIADPESEGLSAEPGRWLKERLVGHPGRTVSEPVVLDRPLAEQRSSFIAGDSSASGPAGALRD
jgi:pimeloyl-ACP methyl ester carboxylesterase